MSIIGHSTRPRQESNLRTRVRSRCSIQLSYGGAHRMYPRVQPCRSGGSRAATPPPYPRVMADAAPHQGQGRSRGCEGRRGPRREGCGRSRSAHRTHAVRSGGVYGGQLLQGAGEVPEITKAGASVSSSGAHGPTAMAFTSAPCRGTRSTSWRSTALIHRETYYVNPGDFRGSVTLRVTPPRNRSAVGSAPRCPSTSRCLPRRPRGVQPGQLRARLQPVIVLRSRSRLLITLNWRICCL